MAAKPVVWTAEKIAALRAAIAAGQTRKAAAASLQVTVKALDRARAKYCPDARFAPAAGSMEKRGRNQALLAALRAGAGPRELARRFGISERRVGQIVDRALPNALASARARRDAGIVAGYVPGSSAAAMAEKFGVSTTVVRRALAAAGITPPPVPPARCYGPPSNKPPRGRKSSGFYLPGAAAAATPFSPEIEAAIKALVKRGHRVMPQGERRFMINDPRMIVSPRELQAMAADPALIGRRLAALVMEAAG